MNIPMECCASLPTSSLFPADGDDIRLLFSGQVTLATRSSEKAPTVMVQSPGRFLQDKFQKRNEASKRLASVAIITISKSLISQPSRAYE